eukprot:GSChrysophyteH1.ASY1.ANO1.2283.1 assembled CDS
MPLPSFDTMNYRLEQGKASIHERVLSFAHNTRNEPNPAADVVELNGHSISLEVLDKIGKGAKVKIPQDTIDNLKKSRTIIDKIVAADAPVYGINTGFGLMSHTKIDIKELEKLQANLIRSHASARGHSGISLSTFQTLVDLFNAGLTPEVPSQGTVGASAKEALERHGITPAVLGAKDGLSMVNVAQPIMALTLVALHGHLNAFDRRDAYSLRCTPAVHGPALEMMTTLRDTIEFEMNCSTDNPLYPAKAFDTMALYVGEIGRISAARVSMLVDPARNRQLPAFLGADAGLDSGFMCWELTAAALDAENRTLSMPSSAETINTGAGKEDHVSMGGFSARKAVQVIENVLKILAIELLHSVHAVHRRYADASGKPGTGKDFKLPPLLEKLFSKVAPLSPAMNCDRYLKDDYDEILKFIQEELPYDVELVTPKS